MDMKAKVNLFYDDDDDDMMMMILACVQ